MSFENLNTELQEKIKNCKTREELDLLVKATGIELSEEELAAVSGGVRGVKCEFNYCEGFEPGA